MCIRDRSSIGTFFEFFKNVRFERIKLALSFGTFLGFRQGFQPEIFPHSFSVKTCFSGDFTYAKAL
ncbi:hypothetical protein DU66_02755 [Methanosarcina mazei]|uniref:Uncharacterized protein n=1 Tax=Methanosarcina mazei TaxID=2209 RepID=A0A0F8JMR8_METMZ|nr:hypothetical protein DU66_02755 [Methanosarcina mazei]